MSRALNGHLSRQLHSVIRQTADVPVELAQAEREPEESLEREILFRTFCFFATATLRESRPINGRFVDKATPPVLPIALQQRGGLEHLSRS
jgi:hypothetical protein